MAVIEFMDKGQHYSLLIVVKGQLINLMRDAVTITHYRKV